MSMARTTEAEVLGRLAAARITIGVVVLISSVCELNSQTIHTIAMVIGGPSDAPAIEVVLVLSRWATAIFAIAVIAGAAKWVMFALAVSYGVLSRILAEATPGYFNYNTHLFWLLLIVAFSDSMVTFAVKGFPRSYSLEHNVRVLSISRIGISFVYLLSLISKLSVSGTSWFTTGQGVAYALNQSNSTIAVWLLSQEGAPSGIAIGAGCFEGLFPFLVMIPSVRHLVVMCALLFHWTIWLILGISFWHLWILFPALYLSLPCVYRRPSVTFANCSEP